jgi:patatin-like phospholipase/acyl hydrolase
MAAFRVLSLDGGGLMGAFSASVLATLERTTGRRIFEHFDLITGTSTGGIIAIGLAMGAPAEELVRFYEERGAVIFPPVKKGVGGWLKTARNLRRPKFAPNVLRETIKTVVGDRPLSAARTRLVIPAYDASMGRIYVFKTPHNPDRLQDSDVPAVDVALATSAAPTFFPAHAMPEYRGVFIDGGVWANCPAMVGIVEAVGFCGQRLEDVHLLSISTTNYPFRIAEPIQLGGLLGWGRKIVETLMFGQAQGAVAQAVSLLRDRFHRIDYLTEPRIYVMDDARVVKELITLGRGEAEKIEHRQVVRERFLNGIPVTASPPWA